MTWKHEKKCHLRACGFFLKLIGYHYLEYISLFNVKKFKKDIHLNKPLNKSLNLNVLIIL